MSPALHPWAFPFVFRIRDATHQPGWPELSSQSKLQRSRQN